MISGLFDCVIILGTGGTSSRGDGKSVGFNKSSRQRAKSKYKQKFQTGVVSSKQGTEDHPKMKSKSQAEVRDYRSVVLKLGPGGPLCMLVFCSKHNCNLRILISS